MSGFIRRSKRTVDENPWIRFEACEIVHPSGHAGEHGLVWAPPAVAVVALDGADVLLARQWRFAIDCAIVEVVKGGGTSGNRPAACASESIATLRTRFADALRAGPSSANSSAANTRI